MCSELKLLQSFDVHAHINCKFPCELSDTNYFSIITSKGILVYKMYFDKDNNSPKTSLNVLTIEPSTYVMPLKLGINLENIIEELEQHEVLESVFRSDISATIENCTKVKFSVKNAKWSNSGVIGNHCIIAILNDCGSLDLYFKIITAGLMQKYTHIANITEEHIEYYKSVWKSTIGMKPSEMFSEYLSRLEMHSPNAFTFSNIFINDKFCFLIMSTLCGRITFWKIMCVELENYASCKPEFFTDYDVKVKNITALHWVFFKNVGLLFLGDFKGRAFLLPAHFKLNLLNFGPLLELIKTDDFKPVEHITSQFIDNFVVIFLIKCDEMVIFVMNENGQIVDKCVYKAGNLNIIDFKYLGDNKFIMLCMTGVLKELEIRVTNEKVNINWRHIYVNMNWTYKKPLGLMISSNAVLFGIIVSNFRIDILGKKDTDVFHIFLHHNRAKDPVQFFLTTRICNMKSFYDYIEVARITGIQNKKFINYENLENSVFKNLDTNVKLSSLKVLYYLSRVNELIYNTIESINPATWYGTKSATQIQLMISIKLSLPYVVYLLKKSFDGESLSVLQQTSIYMIVSYLKELLLQKILEELNIKDHFQAIILHVLSLSKHMEFDVPVCVICDNSLLGSSCMNSHNDDRCAISMVQLLHRRYVCSFCNISVSDEVVEDVKLSSCPFCDIDLDYELHQNVPKKLQMDANVLQEMEDDNFHQISDVT